MSRGRSCWKCGRDRLTDADFYSTGQVCRECKRAEVKAQRARVMADPYLRERANRSHRAAQRRRRDRDPAKVKAYRKARWQRLKADPERHAQVKAERRMQHRLRLERAGQPLPSRVLSSVANPRAEVGKGGFGPAFDPEPVRQFIDLVGGTSAAARGDDILDRSLRRIVAGEPQHVTLALIDRLLSAHDNLLMHDLYDPNDYPEVYAA